MEYITKNAEETKALGRRLGNSLKGGTTLALSGELGSGKTTFIQGLAEGLGVRDRIISPTFILVRKYQSEKLLNFYHVDLYRLEGDLGYEMNNLGLTDFMKDKDSIVAIEWAEKAREYLPKNMVWIKFDILEDNRRKIVTNL